MGRLLDLEVLKYIALLSLAAGASVAAILAIYLWLERNYQARCRNSLGRRRRWG